MTPAQYVDYLAHLMAERREAEALDLARSMHPVVQSRLSLEQLDFVGSLLEAAAMTVKIDELEADELNAAAHSA